MSFIFSCIIQACVVMIFLYGIFFIATIIFNLTRIFIYRITFHKYDFMTNDEKRRFGLIEKNVLQPNVEVINSGEEPVSSYEEFESLWERNNEILDMKMKQSKIDPDEIFFQGRVKRRR